MKKFPHNFYWGAATSAHQVEGNAHNNWSVWEKVNARRLAREAKDTWAPWQQEKFPEMCTQENYISGIAADHYNRYKEDFDLAREGGHNAHRFSIDWARVEPIEGQFDAEAIAHYVDVVQALRARGLEPFVTLWHWTHPVWLEDRGGVLAPNFAQKFAHYAHTMVEAFGDDVQFVMTLNEPMSVISSQYITGAWPHARKGMGAFLTAYKHLADAHISAYREIKNVEPKVQIGFTEILASFQPRCSWNGIDQLIVKIGRHWSNERFAKMTKGYFDFLGVQHYFHFHVGLLGLKKRIDVEQSDLGWELHAEGLHKVIMEYAQYGVPVYVTEDGLADRDDDKRPQFITDHLGQVARAIDDGADVRGYFHWSLIDNFEWDKGYWPRFGLVEVDRTTLTRTPRKSFYTYKQIIKNNSLGNRVSK